MKKICIPVLIIEYILLLFVFSVIYLLINIADDTFNILYVIPIPFLLLLYFVLELFIKCPKCKKCLHINKNGIYRPPLLHCDKCGQNLMKCEVEVKKDEKV